MNNALSTYLNGRDNNFNLIRIIAAVLVLVSHCYPLFYGSSDYEPLKRLVGISIGSVAVDLFFISSGFLIANSFFYQKNLINFIKARILRIYPGLIVSLIITVFFLGLVFTKLTTTAYLTDFQTYKFLFKNMFLFLGEEATLPGVFEGLPWANTVNGSLWTLPFEVRAYALLVLVGILLGFCEQKWKTLSFKKVYLLIPIVGLGVYFLNYFHPILPISYFSAEYARLLSMFFIGVAFYRYREKIILSKKLFLILSASLIVSALDSHLFFVVYNCTLAYLVFFLAYIPKGFIRKFNKYGDYSYGIYIYAFPVQQALLVLYPKMSLFEFFLTSLGSTFVFAYFSWQLIEKKALKLKNKRVKS
ncbi:acyltransferase family protein [Thalassotalea profundi]|uniref:Acyltransferase n=1 Tax=Thalassotalea profundi TaxID=2036687 RepID=A0ABQ3IQQ3_9GAMM|nr:acyltransferase [Thalassotalea profundi]GHE89441.1 acyltransferase [Thalassotalea profundi]